MGELTDALTRNEHRRTPFERRVDDQLQRAYAKHGRDPWGRHEFFAILKEEVDELWDAVKSDLPIAQVLAEAEQIACVCRRYAETGDRYQGPHRDPQEDDDGA